jgi:Reverse transcriptase (RNA-dependent DNA polymerase)
VGLKFSVLNNVAIFHDRVFESMFVKIMLCNKEYVFGNIYRPNIPVGNLTSNDLTSLFNEYLVEVLSKKELSKSNVYIFGDFNIDLLKIETNKLTADYVESLFSLGYLQIVTKPTRCIHGSSTLIDHVLTNASQAQFNCCILLSRISDHFPIICTIESSKDKPKKSTFSTRNFSKGNINRFKAALNQVSWNPLLEVNNAQESYTLFHDDFFALFDMYFPVKTCRFNRNINKKEKWMTKGLLTSRLRKIKLCKQSIKVPSLENVENFKKYRNLYNVIVRKSKKSFYDQQFESNKFDLKKTWSLLYEVIKKSKHNGTTVEHLMINNVLVSDPLQIVNQFNNHFATVTDRIVQNIEPTDRPPDRDVKNCSKKFNLSSSPVPPSEIIEIISELKSKSSSDIYGLSSNFIKNISFSLARPLAHIFSLSLAEGVFPNELKLAKIVPIFKGGDANNVDNYRPISLLPIFSKILEKIMSKRLNVFLEVNNILSNAQYGFRKKHNTQLPILQLLNKITDASNKKEFSISIFCDLQKAFDCVDHEILLKKLCKMGISGVELSWFKSYLTNRKQFVSLNNVNSDYTVIRRGVPQGSILGPLLFLLYINDLPESTKLFILLFADDTTLFASGSNLTELIKFINKEFQKVCEFFRANKLLLHPEKTKFMIFDTTGGKIPYDDVKIYLDNNNCSSPLKSEAKMKQLSCINSNSTTPAIKFLGIYFDNKVNFK